VAYRQKCCKLRGMKGNGMLSGRCWCFFLLCSMIYAYTASAQCDNDLRVLRRIDSLYRKLPPYEYIVYNPRHKTLLVRAFDTVPIPMANIDHWRKYCRQMNWDTLAFFALIDIMENTKYLFVGCGGLGDCCDCSTKIVTKKKIFRKQFRTYYVMSSDARRKNCSIAPADANDDPYDCIDGYRIHLLKLKTDIYRSQEKWEIRY
jgi:hypothetical protein